MFQLRGLDPDKLLRRMNKNSRARATVLAHVPERGSDGIEIGDIGQDDLRVLPAAFEAGGHTPIASCQSSVKKLG